MKEDSTYFQSKYAKHWLKESGTFEKSRYYKIVRELILSYRPQTAIELGIGTGYPNAFLLAKSGIKMFGVDIAEKLLKQCKDRFQKHGLDVTVEVADMCRLPFRDQSFDCAFCISSSWYVSDIESLISEMFRVSRDTVVLDIINLWHINGLLHWIYKPIRGSLIATKIFGESFVPIVRRVEIVKKLLEKSAATCEVRGFEILFPSYWPLLQDRVNMVKYFPNLDYGLSSSWLQFFASKILFICGKQFTDSIRQ